MQHSPMLSEGHTPDEVLKKIDTCCLGFGYLKHPTKVLVWYQRDGNANLPSVETTDTLASVSPPNQYGHLTNMDT